MIDVIKIADSSSYTLHLAEIQVINKLLTSTLDADVTRDVLDLTTMAVWRTTTKTVMSGYNTSLPPPPRSLSDLHL